MVEVPEPHRSSRANQQRPKWVSVQIEPVTSKQISQRQMPGGVLSPDYRVRIATANATSDIGTLLSTVLMDPVYEVRKTAVGRLAELYSTSNYTPGFAIRLATCCTALAHSEDLSHQQLARLIAAEVVSRTVTAGTPSGAFGTLVVALFLSEAVSKEQRDAARAQIKGDSYLESILQAIAKKNLTFGAGVTPDSEIDIIASEIEHNKRRNLDLDSVCAVMAYLSKDERVANNGASRLAAMSQSYERSQFDLRVLGFLATPVSSPSSAAAFGKFQFEEGDIANLAPWIVLRYGSSPEASSPQDEAARCAEFGESEWARVSQPLLEKLEQYCATGSPTALIGAARVLRVFGRHTTNPDLDRACIDVAMAQLGAFRNLRAAARFSDTILAQEISAHVRFIAKNCPINYELKPENIETLLGLSSLGLFDPRTLIVLTRRVTDITTVMGVTDNLLRHVQIAAMDDNISVKARSLRTQGSLADIADGLTTIIKSWGQNFRMNGELTEIFGALCGVVSATSNHEEFVVIRDKVVGLLVYVSSTIFPPHRRDFNLYTINNLASRLLAPNVPTSAPLCKLLFDLLSSPISPTALLEPVKQQLRFAALDSGKLIQLFRKLSAQLTAPRSTAVQNDFDWREVLIDTLIEVSQYILSEDWGVQNASITIEELAIAISACQFVANNPSESSVTRLKANRLLAILKGT